MSVIGPVVTMDRVIRDDLPQATTTTDIWMRERRAAFAHYEAVGDTLKRDFMLQLAQDRAATGADWLASFEKFFTGGQPVQPREYNVVSNGGLALMSSSTNYTNANPGSWCISARINVRTARSSMLLGGQFLPPFTNWGLNLLSDGKIFVGVGDEYPISGISVIPTQDWASIIVSVDSTRPLGNRVQAYVNDVKVAFTSDATTFTAPATPLRVFWDGSSSPLDVWVDHLAFFTGYSPDLDVEAERRRFFDDQNNTERVGAYFRDTGIPTTPVWAMGLHDTRDTWEKLNVGGGDFVLRGTFGPAFIVTDGFAFNNIGAAAADKEIVFDSSSGPVEGNTSRGWADPELGAPNLGVPGTGIDWLTHRFDGFYVDTVTDEIVLRADAAGVPQGAFAKFVIADTLIYPNEITLLSGDATYGSSGGKTRWKWPAAAYPNLWFAGFGGRARISDEGTT